jgi:hypothetical protein
MRRASEIVRLAETMAQTHNTDALSWLNKKDLLNQAFIRLYDDLSSAGDMYFVKEARICNNELPCDLFRLIFVGYQNGFELTPILRAPNNSPFNGGYRVINNKIELPPNVPAPVIIRYIPVPETITFPREKTPVHGEADQALYDAARDTLFLGTASRITVITGETYTVDIDGPYAMAISGGVLYVVKEDGINCFDYTGTPLESLSDTFDLYAHAIGWENGIIVRQEGAYKRYTTGGALTDSEDYWNYGEGKIVREGELFIFYNEFGKPQDITGFFYKAEHFVIASPYIFVSRTTGSTRGFFGLEEMEQEKREGQTQKGVVLACDPGESGYGLLFKDFQTGLWLKGYQEDTVLNYPRNIFFDILAVDLAVRMRVSLDMPTGELPAMLDDYNETLMKSLSRDGFFPVRIQNAYGG